MFGTIVVLSIVAVGLSVLPKNHTVEFMSAVRARATSEDVIAPVTAPLIDVARASDPMSESAPVRLAIASIGVDTPLMDLGLQPDGTLEVPPDGVLAGWFTGAPTPGELGPAVIAGHVDWYGPGVFYDLQLMVPGDLIEVARSDGSTAVFRATKVGLYPKNEFPTEAVYGALDFAGLRLITCGGLFDNEAGHYEDNVVVFAELVSSTPVTWG